MTRGGSCACGAVRYTITGEIRDVLVCHCDACREATGGPWAASASGRDDLVVADASALVWDAAPVSECGASRGRCRTCATTVFWDAPDRKTVSFGVATLSDASGLEVAGHIWVGDSPAVEEHGVPRFPRGLPPGVSVPWHA